MCLCVCVRVCVWESASVCEPLGKGEKRTSR
uniref:GH23107p n=1 Tax=Drosophila melanogaster TaxID=7227 RepID=Q8SZJ6_DROME|nr:GH23107p [Drosophila melanogaster]